MTKDSTPVETTSRRQFTRAMVTAAVAAPIAASLAGCQTQSPQPGTPTPYPSPAPAGTGGVHPGEPSPCKTTVKSGYTEITFAGQVGPEEHIPPMGIEGGGSLIIDSRNKLKASGSGSGPFTYQEDVADPEDQYGNIEQAIVLTEGETQPYFRGVIYTGLLPGAQLWIWYQDITPTPQGDDDTTFPTATFPDSDPHVRFIGGEGENPFKIVVTRKRFEETKSHKKRRPHRFKHTGGGGMARHFRIGQWRLVDKAGTTLVGDAGAENYTFYVRYGHFQP